MFKMFKNFNKRDAILIIISLLFIVLQVYLDLKLPDYMAKVTELVTKGETIKTIMFEGLKMLLCALGSLVTAVIVGYCSAVAGTSFGRNLRKRIFRKVEDFNMEEIKEFSTSSLITRNTNDVTQIQMFFIMGIQVLVKAPIMAIWAISKIADKGFEFTLITGIGVFVVMFMMITLVLVALPKFRVIQELTDNLNRITRENLTGIRVVRAFNAEKYQSKRFEKANDDIAKNLVFTLKAMSFLGPTMSLVMSGISLAIYWQGAYLINGAEMMDKITIFGNMVVFSAYAIQVIMSFMMLVMIFILYPRASVSMKRVNEVLDRNISIKDGTINKDKTKIKGKVEFKNVSFKYPDAEECILKNIDFSVNPGETVAFIGSTGSGKSTLINLIPRFYDVTEGRILIDDIDVKDMKLEYLFSKIGYISQKAIMFKGTIKDNISFGKKNNKKVNFDSVKRAIKIAQSTSFVENKEDGYNSLVSQNGTNFSGGQKQRLSIARAIARDPEIYIFDDSFSALDYKTDKLLRRELKKNAKDATIFIVAQRIGTIMDADKIVVLDEGSCVGIGTHRELLKNCQVYKEIAESQLSKEELENA